MYEDEMKPAAEGGWKENDRSGIVVWGTFSALKSSPLSEFKAPRGRLLWLGKKQPSNIPRTRGESLKWSPLMGKCVPKLHRMGGLAPKTVMKYVPWFYTGQTVCVSSSMSKDQADFWNCYRRKYFSGVHNGPVNGARVPPIMKFPCSEFLRLLPQQKRGKIVLSTGRTWRWGMVFYLRFEISQNYAEILDLSFFRYFYFL